MDGLRPDQVHALIRTLLRIQATLTAVGIGAFLFLIPRWWQQLCEELSTQPAIDIDIGQMRARVRRVFWIIFLIMTGGLFIFFLPVIVSWESYLYFTQSVQNELLILILILVYMGKAWFILIPSVFYRGTE